MKYNVKFTEEEKGRFIEISHDGAVAVFAYSKNVFADGKIMHYDEQKRARAVCIDGEIYVPVSFFSDFLGADATTCGIPVRKSEGVDFLPVVGCTRALGYSADVFYEGRLAVIGTEEQLAVMRESENMPEAAAYTLFGDYDAKSFTSDDYKAARQKWAYMLVGSPELNDLSDPIIKEKVDKVSETGENIWRIMNHGEDRVALFGNEPITESAHMGYAYIKLANLAKAWGTWGSRLYHNEELAHDILDGLEWMYQHYYGEDVINGVGWRDPRQFNWWDWFIPTPQSITEIIFIMEDYFTLETRRKYLKCFEWITTIVFNKHDREYAAGRVGVYTQTALATENADMLERAKYDFDWLLELVDDQAGARVDFCQWTHGMPYNNAYGAMHLERGLRIASFLDGTPLEFKSPRLYTYFLLAKYMFEPAMYNGRALAFMAGRATYTVDTTKCASIWWQMLRLYGMFGESEDEYLLGMFFRHARCPELIDKMKQQGTVHTCKLIDKILKQGGKAAEYNYAHSYFTADRAVQQRDNYAFTVSLSSEREPSFEATNFVNLNGWHTGDGATYVYTDYDKNAHHPDKFYLKNNEIAYRFPGTTEDARERIAICVARSYRSKNDFAGSVSVDNKYFVAAMDFMSLNNPVDEGWSGDSGFSLPKHINDLRAKKAYFAFDGDIVCLGAGITSTMDSPVSTTIEHARIVLPGADDQYEGAELLPKSDYEKRATGADFINMVGHAGFVILDGNAYVHRYTHPEIGDSYFEVGISHGANPTDATYAYAILPYADNTRLLKYKASGELEIIKNTAECQAVRKNTVGLTGIVFYSAGECCGITTDAPAIVTVKENEDGTKTLQVTDPTQKAEKITLTLSGISKIMSCHGKISATTENGIATLTVDTNRAKGRRFDIKYR